MSRIGRNISIVLRAERMIARRNMAVLRNQAALLALAALVGIMGLVMTNIAAFFWLRADWSPPVAALIVAVADIALAALLAVIANRQDAGPAIGPIGELRDLAIEDLEEEVQVLVDEIRDVSGNVRRMARDPLEAALPALAGPLAAAILRGLSRHRGDGEGK